MNEILRVRCEDRSGVNDYSVRILHEFGQGSGYLNPKKIADIWRQISKYPVLFSDYTEGKIEPFLAILMNPNSVWFEVYNETTDRTVGAVYVDRVIPGFDAQGHFAVWDSVANGRQPIFWGIMEWLMERYGLRRLSCGVPPYQAGTIRFAKSLGFKQEGERREAVIYKGRWFPLIEFGILRDELEEARKNGIDTTRRREERNSGRGERGSESTRRDVSADDARDGEGRESLHSHDERGHDEHDGLRPVGSGTRAGGDGESDGPEESD